MQIKQCEANVLQQNVLYSYDFKKRETEATNPRKNKFTQPFPPFSTKFFYLQVKIKIKHLIYCHTTVQ